MTNLTPEQYERILETMAPAVREKLTLRFIAALDAGHDIYSPVDGTSPAGEMVMAETVAEARALGWSPKTISMLRWNVRAIGRTLILAAVEA